MHSLRFTLKLPWFFGSFIVRKLGSLIEYQQFRVAVMLFEDWSWSVVGCLVPGIVWRSWRGVNEGLSQVRIAHLFGCSPSVVCPEVARHTGPDGQYRAEEPGKAARAARRRPKKRLLDCDEVLRRRVIADFSQGHTPRQISGRLRAEACNSLSSMDTSFKAQRAISHEAIYTWSRHRPLLWGKPDSHAPIVQRRLVPQPHRR